MEPPKDILETNTAKLIQAGMGGEARLDPQLRQQLHQRLLGELRAGAKPPAFPEKALGTLTALCLLAALGAAVQFSQVGLQTLENSAWPILIPLVLLNLILTPIASIIIVLRRKSDDQAN